MDIIETPPYEEMQKYYTKTYSLGYLNTDITTKFALISLIDYLTMKLKEKKPDITHYKVIKAIIKDELPEDFIKGLAVVCSDFAYGCNNFPTFGIETKQIPNKIKGILQSYLPF